MRTRKILVLAAVVAAAVGAIAAVIWPAQPVLLPPVVRLSDFEPGGVTDDNGTEMRLLTIKIRNPNFRQPSGKGVLFVKNDGRACEVKSGDQWNEVGRAWVSAQFSPNLQMCELGPGEERNTLLLLPGGSESCRIWLQYVGGRVSYRVRMAYLVQRLPQFIRSRIAFKVWRWAGFPEATPRSDWREMNVEIPFSHSIIEKAL